MSFRTRLIALVVLACLVTGAAVGVVTFRTGRQALFDDRLGRLLENADAALLLFEAGLEPVEAATQSLAMRPEFGRLLALGQPGLARPELERAIATMPLVAELTISDLKGVAETTGRTAGSGGPVSIGGQTDVRETVESGRPTLGTAALSSVSGGPVLPYSVLVRDGLGRAAGVLRANIALDQLAEGISGKVVGSVSLIDLRDGALLVHQDLRRIGTRSSSAEPAVASLLAGERLARIFAGDTERDTVVAVTASKTRPWGIVLARPVLGDGGPILTMVWWMMALTSAAVLVLGALAVWLVLGMTRSLRRLHTAVNDFAAGRLDRRAPTRGSDEISDLGRTFNTMAAALAGQVSELERSREMIIAAEERQRSEVADFLHSRVQSRLLVAAHHLSELERLTDMDPEQAQMIVAQARKQIDDVREHDIRRASHLLHPGIIRFGLTPALESLADSTSSLEVVLQIDDAVTQLEQPAVEGLPEDMRLAVYRIVQDALSNAIRHAGAVQAVVAARLVASSGGQTELEVSVRDNGRGFNPAEVRPGLGLGTIAARTSQFGGTWRIVSTPGQGATLTVRFPVSMPSEPHTTEESPRADGEQISIGNDRPRS